MIENAQEAPKHTLIHTPWAPVELRMLEWLNSGEQETP